MSDNSALKTFDFSVVIAVYNVENFLKQTINSVINQTYGFEKFNLFWLMMSLLIKVEKFAMNMQENIPIILLLYIRKMAVLLLRETKDLSMQPALI